MKYILSLMVSIMLLFSCNNSNEKKNLNDQDQLIIAQDSTRSIKENKEKITAVYDSIISIAELRENKEKYKNAMVTLRGNVTNYNPNIMNINWVRIQDGTEFNGKKYIALTTSAEVTMGDTISIKGKVSLDKDLGSGYVYDILIENAIIK